MISDLLRSLLVPFWGETARVGRPTANTFIVFETFKHWHNLKAWLRASFRGAGNFFELALHVFVQSLLYGVLRDTNTNCALSDP